MKSFLFLLFLPIASQAQLAFTLKDALAIRDMDMYSREYMDKFKDEGFQPCTGTFDLPDCHKHRYVNDLGQQHTIFVYKNKGGSVTCKTKDAWAAAEWKGILGPSIREYLQNGENVEVFRNFSHDFEIRSKNAEFYLIIK